MSLKPVISDPKSTISGTLSFMHFPCFQLLFFLSNQLPLVEHQKQVHHELVK